MEEAARSPLVSWESFYVIVGSSGAALTGLQFVVIAMLRSDPRRVLFVVGATAVLLLFIGIHNAWDTVTYITIGGMQTPEGSEEPKGRGESDSSSRQG